MQQSSFRARGARQQTRHYGPSRRQNSGGGRRMGQYIDPRKFVNKSVTPKEVVAYDPTHKFVDFGFEPALQRNIDARGYVHPTPVQDEAIKPIMQGKDLIGLANTGTGKTAAFVLPIIQQLLKNPAGVRALIVAPTRELAVQIDDEFRAFVKDLRLYSAVCVGGVNIGPQIRQLSRGPHVVIGTPGRLKDLLQQRALRLDRTNVVVLDEADRMLDMGFVRDIQFLLQQLPEQRQSLCFSATITPEISRLLDGMLKDPVTVSVRTSETSDHVEQDVIKATSAEHKLEILTDLLKKPDFDKVIIFGETKWGVQRLADRLTADGIRAEAIHGNKSQGQRQRALNAFKANQVKVLVATDVAARGIDIPNVSHVINFDQPSTYDDYVHRIGRTGRGGKHGSALTFIA